MKKQKNLGIGGQTMKCPYCKGKNLYLKQTFPVVKYGCMDCEKVIKYLRECGLTNRQIEKIITGIRGSV